MTIESSQCEEYGVMLLRTEQGHAIKHVEVPDMSMTSMKDCVIITNTNTGRCGRSLSRVVESERMLAAPLWHNVERVGPSQQRSTPVCKDRKRAICLCESSLCWMTFGLLWRSVGSLFKSSRPAKLLWTTLECDWSMRAFVSLGRPVEQSDSCPFPVIFRVRWCIPIRDSKSFGSIHAHLRDSPLKGENAAEGVSALHVHTKASGSPEGHSLTLRCPPSMVACRWRVFGVLDPRCWLVPTIGVKDSFNVMLRMLNQTSCWWKSLGRMLTTCW